MAFGLAIMRVATARAISGEHTAIRRAHVLSELPPLHYENPSGVGIKVRYAQLLNLIEETAT